MVFQRKHAFRSQRAEVREYKRRIIASGISASLILILAVLVWYGTRRTEVTLAHIAVSGGTTVSHDAIRSKADSVLSGSYALLIPRRFAYLYPHDELVAAINSVPRVHGATIERTSHQELKVTFEEYMPYALWCDAFAYSSSTPASCLFVDDRGYAYADAPPLLGETLVRFIIEGRMPEVGVFVHEQGSLERLKDLAQAIFENHEHRLRGITETKDKDLTLHLSGDIDVLIRKDADVDAIFTTIESLLSAPEFIDVPLEGFEYIDLRFGNKVYVKQRGAGEVEDTTASTTPQ